MFFPLFRFYQKENEKPNQTLSGGFSFVKGSVIFLGFLQFLSNQSQKGKSNYGLRQPKLIMLSLEREAQTDRENKLYIVYSA
jgi:hypothetical protein